MAAMERLYFDRRPIPEYTDLELSSGALMPCPSEETWSASLSGPSLPCPRRPAARSTKPVRSERAAERRGGGTFRPSWQVRRGFEAAHAPVSCRQPAPIVGGSGRRNKKSVPGHHYRYCSVLGVGTDADACGAPVRFLTPVGVPDARAAAASTISRHRFFLVICLFCFF